MANNSDDTRKYLLTSADVDFEGKIKISALTNFLIQSASQHAEQFGWGVDELSEKNLTWVLSGIQIKIYRYAEWKNEIWVETWPKGIHRLFYLRDYRIYNIKNEVIAEASSNWLLIDKERRRPSTHKIYDAILKENENRHAIEEVVPTVKFSETPDYETTYKVRYSHIDVNQHLTTTSYIDFVLDTFTPAFISSNRPKEIIVNFLHEVLYGAELKMERYSTDNNTKTFFRLINSSTNKGCFCALLTF